MFVLISYLNMIYECLLDFNNSFNELIWLRRLLEVLLNDKNRLGTIKNKKTHGDKTAAQVTEHSLRKFPGISKTPTSP